LILETYNIHLIIMNSLVICALVCLASVVLAEHDEEKSMRDISDSINRHVREVQVAKKSVEAERAIRGFAMVNNEVFKRTADFAKKAVLAEHEEKRHLREVQVAKKSVLADHEEKSMRDISDSINRHLREIQVAKKSVEAERAIRGFAMVNNEVFKRTADFAKKAVLAEHEEKSMRDISDSINRHLREVQVAKKSVGAERAIRDFSMVNNEVFKRTTEFSKKAEEYGDRYRRADHEEKSMRD